ncbi:hypothetical protein PISL3812_08410 [Talaromyces islandicus]|uniref:Tat pathway signal sequence n=1 Tax=Talaromyces islandicus TaxID=28573 RepID=A0A0U1M7M0_TALIS|nr:hypothetical protein PISL3812_08410 [Talaromyces islandicus]
MADIDKVSRSSLEDEEEKTALWPHSPEDNFAGATRPKEKWTQRRLLCINVAMLCFSLVILVLAGVLRYDPEYRGRNALLKKTSAYSPLFDELDIPLVTVQGSSFFDNSGFYLTTDQVIKLGKDPEQTVRSNEHPDLHIGIINGMHELHCLNVIRKNLHRDYYWPEGIRHPVHWIHLYHCVEVVVNALMCTGNMDVVTFNWMETQSAPFFDFSFNRVCRDFDRILEWQTEALSDMEDVHRVEGSRELQAPSILQALNAQRPEDRAFTHDDPAFVGIGL